MVDLHRGAAVAALFFALGASAAVAQTPADPAAPVLPETYATLLTPLLTGNLTIIGQEVAYPTGTPNVSAFIVTIAPGAETGWHSHEVPLIAYILEGTATIDYGSKGVRSAGPGTTFIEAMNWAHNAHNHGDVPVKILAIYVGEAGTANANPAPGAE